MNLTSDGQEPGYTGACTAKPDLDETVTYLVTPDGSADGESNDSAEDIVDKMVEHWSSGSGSSGGSGNNSGRCRKKRKSRVAKITAAEDETAAFARTMLMARQARDQIFKERTLEEKRVREEERAERRERDIEAIRQREDDRKDRQADRETMLTAVKEMVRAFTEGQSQISQVTAQARPTLIEQIRELKELHAAGSITDEEFAQCKSTAIASSRQG